ncbi:hypothetical protein [Ignicoccus hospitalis]|uniref:Uncharacterized protein n=1 Tax=Ignicoccus hospitalis (strain KIN4/I / DSM 18386 / JCM 14125) TaxID=453591 RepID=A8ABC1_IGNH4|nr:hypothetical protein [Ignicoccus hospitalis]ABU82223.1 hypothetical protein Igni_1045 [Ignicoccus hospitalis KIN4/I]HIH90160.1 hypothetical protein [Desulfurococcaceae archaeon]
MTTTITPEELLLICSTLDLPECEMLYETLRDPVALSLLGEEGLRELFEKVSEKLSRQRAS